MLIEKRLRLRVAEMLDVGESILTRKNVVC
jgi:hypothetical protein